MSVVVLSSMAFLSACSPRSEQQTITIKGSDTMVQLGQRWAEIYMKENPGIVIQVTGGGSGTGIAALINGSTDIAQASRQMNHEEKEAARESRGDEVVEIPVALDALAMYLNSTNPIDSLSINQVSGIFRGEITNFSEVGGLDETIILYGRESSSGTYVYFKEKVLDEMDFAPQTQTLPGTAAVVNAVANDPNGIGYGGIGYSSGIKTISITSASDGNRVDPTIENVLNNNYPLSRNLFFYSIGEPRGLLAEFRDWVLGPSGQAVIEEVGYYPLGALSYTE